MKLCLLVVCLELIIPKKFYERSMEVKLPRPRFRKLDRPTNPPTDRPTNRHGQTAKGHREVSLPIMFVYLVLKILAKLSRRQMDEMVNIMLLFGEGKEMFPL